MRYFLRYKQEVFLISAHNDIIKHVGKLFSSSQRLTCSPAHRHPAYSRDLIIAMNQAVSRRGGAGFVTGLHIAELTTVDRCMSTGSAVAQPISPQLINAVEADSDELSPTLYKSQSLQIFGGV